MSGTPLMLGLILALAGSLLASLCAMVLRWKAFKESVGWGLACLFLPLADLVFVFRFWRLSRALFWGQLGGVALMISGWGIMGLDSNFRTGLVHLMDPKAVMAQAEAEADSVWLYPTPAPQPACTPSPALTPAPQTKNQVLEVQKKLQRWYDDLQQRRPGPGASPDEVRAFNAECGRYQQIQKQYELEKKALASKFPNP